MFSVITLWEYNCSHVSWQLIPGFWSIPKKLSQVHWQQNGKHLFTCKFYQHNISEFPRTGPIFKNQENTMTWGFPTFTLSAYPQPSRIQRSSGKSARWITWSISCKYLIKKQVAGQERFTLTHLDIAVKNVQDYSSLLGGETTMSTKTCMISCHLHETELPRFHIGL